MNVQTFNPVALQQRIEQMPVQQLMQQSSQVAKMLKKEPRNYQLHYTLALMLRSSGETLSVVNHLKKALKLQPKFEHALQIICEILMKNLGKHSEALKYLKKWQLVHKGSDSALIWTCIAECYIEMGKPEEAFKALDRAKRLNPNLQRVYLVGKKIFSKAGDQDLAMENAQKAFDIEPNEAATIAIADLPSFGTDKDTIEKIAEVAGGAKDPKSFTYLHAQAANGFEKLGDYERAFQHIELSNKMVLEQLDIDETLVAFKNLRETFTKDYLESRFGTGHESKQPIFIVGMPRSGTTLTESILAGHPDILDNGELDFLLRFMVSIGLQKNQDFALQQGHTMQFHMHGAPMTYLKELGQGYLDESGFDKKSKKMQVDKLPHNFMAVGLISVMFPNAKIIHCRRHPIDCALSCYKQTFRGFHSYATDLEILGLYYRQYWELMQHWREVLPGKMFEVCYEDTVTNKALVARNMIEYIGLDWDDRCLDHTASKKTVNTASVWQVRQPIYTTSIAKWKHYEKQLQPMINKMGSCVEEYEAELAAMAN